MEHLQFELVPCCHLDHAGVVSFCDVGDLVAASHNCTLGRHLALGLIPLGRAFLVKAAKRIRHGEGVRQSPEPVLDHRPSQIAFRLLFETLHMDRLNLNFRHASSLAVFQMFDEVTL